MIKSIALLASLQIESHDCSYWKFNSNQCIGRKGLGSVPNTFILASTYTSPCVLHQLLWYLHRAHLRSSLERLPVGLSCQHPMMCPVEGVGTFLGDASTCPGCACFPSSQQSSHADERALRHLLWSLLHKQWGLVSKTFNGPSNTVPSTFLKDQSLD